MTAKKALFIRDTSNERQAKNLYDLSYVNNIESRIRSARLLIKDTKFGIGHERRMA